MLETTQPYWPLNDITCVTKVQLLRQNVPDLNFQKFALEEGAIHILRNAAGVGG